MSYIIEYKNKMYQVICDSFENVLEPDGECFSFDIEDDVDDTTYSNLIGMTSDNGLSLTSLFSNAQVNDDFDDKI